MCLYVCVCFSLCSWVVCVNECVFWGVSVNCIVSTSSYSRDPMKPNFCVLRLSSPLLYCTHINARRSTGWARTTQRHCWRHTGFRSADQTGVDCSPEVMSGHWRDLCCVLTLGSSMRCALVGGPGVPPVPQGRSTGHEDQSGEESVSQEGLQRALSQKCHSWLLCLAMSVTRPEQYLFFWAVVNKNDYTLTHKIVRQAPLCVQSRPLEHHLPKYT